MLIFFPRVVSCTVYKGTERILQSSTYWSVYGRQCHLASASKAAETHWRPPLSTAVPAVSIPPVSSYSASVLCALLAAHEHREAAAADETDRRPSGKASSSQSCSRLYLGLITTKIFLNSYRFEN